MKREDVAKEGRSDSARSKSPCNTSALCRDVMVGCSNCRPDLERMFWKGPSKRR